MPMRSPAVFPIPTLCLNVCLGGLVLLLAACSAPQVKVDTTPKKAIRRAEVMAIAEAYTQHRWRAAEANIRHGNDARGIRVDTPDIGYQPADGTRAGWWIPGRWNVGMPYQWGGFDTLETFDQKVGRGLAAGDIYTPVKRAGLDAAVSQEAAGIDCSGLVSRCWRLDRPYSTRELPSLCIRLGSHHDLRPGDILNTHNAHVLIFAGWGNPARTRVNVYEAGCHPTWKVYRRQVRMEFLQEKGYQAYRYRGIRD
jgi:hypothetical protein